jgi:hypothetical protein
VASSAPENGFVEVGDGVTRFYKSILELIQKYGIPHIIQKYGIPHRVASDCIAW